MKNIANFLYVIVLMLAFTACEHKELCLYHEHVDYSRLRVNVDWTDFLPFETPTGMTVAMYPRDGKEPIVALTNNIDYAVLSLPEGTYDMLVYNQSISEFGSMHFSDMENFAESKVIGAATSSRWYISRLPEETVIAQPEWLGLEVQTGLQVTSRMVEKTNEYIAQSLGGRADGDTVLTTAYQRNVISTLQVNVHIKGIHNLRASRASITGMANGYMLGKNCPASGIATQLLETWSIDVDKADPTQGVITALITSFGLPYGHAGVEDENELMLSLLLVDGKTVLDFSFAVGDKFEYEEGLGTHVRLALRLNLDLETTLPDVKPEGGGSSGFDATIDDWGDEEDYDIGM